MSANAPRLRSLYRSLLRELPLRSPGSPSPIHARVRATLLSTTETAESKAMAIEQAEQFINYVKAQRMYATLVERYNPGMSMDEEEKIRLTARRVGMDLPDDVVVPGKEGN